MFYLSIREDIKMKSKTTSTLVFAMVLAMGLTLVLQSGAHPTSVLAKSSDSHKGKSSSSSGGSSGGSSGKLASLVTCETSSAKATSGELTQNDLMKCFNQAYGNGTGTAAATLANGSGGGSSY